MISAKSLENSKIFVLILMLMALVQAEGLLNIFTGDQNAEIYIDGEYINKEQVLKKSLTEGSHYIQVKKNGKALASRTVNIVNDKLESVVIEDFVDYKTTVASRGAVEVEAMRVRETRGNIAFGAYGGSPASGLSLKWWPAERFGLQTIGYVNNFSGNVDSRGGVRLLVMLGESVYQGSTLTTYCALGTGHAMIRNRFDGEKNEVYDLSEGVLGIEFKLSNLFGEQNQQEYKHVVIDDNTSPFAIVFTQFIVGLGESFMKFTHLSLEVGVERTFTRYFTVDPDESSTEKTNAKFSGGFHVYF